MGTAASTGGAAAETLSGTTDPGDTAINQDLASMAKQFATAVTDKTVRLEVHDGVAERFDGDEDLLWETFASTPSVARALESTDLARTTGPVTALRAVDDLAVDVPRFQISVPENFDDWDPAAYTPMVAYVPEGVEDTELETITAYDASGTAHQIDAQLPPEQPVIVLGVNERTDDDGNLLTPTRSITTETAPAAMAAAAATYEVRMVKVNLINDHEPWPKGDAEIALRAQSKGCSGTSYTDHNWASLNDNEDWWYGPRYLGNTKCDVIFKWWEDDGSGFDFTLGFKGVSLGVKMDDGDDIIGGMQVAHSKFSGGSDSVQEWSSLKQWTD